MHVFLISGDGNGAGKSTVAERLVGSVNVVSFARGIRHAAEMKYPGYNWHSKDPAYKNTTVVRELAGKTVRDVLVAIGEAACVEDPLYWARRLGDHLKRVESNIYMPVAIAVDDLRKVCELDYLRDRYPALTHFHVVSPSAGAEPQYQNDELRGRADYVITWRGQ